MKYIILLCLTATVTAIDIIGRTQSIGARGRLTCNGKPAADVVVKLYDSDNSVLPGILDTDDLLASTKTNSEGEYSLAGITKEVTDIEPYIYIYHECNDGDTPCQRAFRINIPSKHITEGERPTSIYDAGLLELSGEFPNEERSCMN